MSAFRIFMMVTSALVFVLVSVIMLCELPEALRRDRERRKALAAIRKAAGLDNRQREVGKGGT